MSLDIASSNDPTEREYELLRHELEEAHMLNRRLLRQIEKTQQAASEAQRAHAKMVATLTETMRENTLLATELALLRTRTQRTEPTADDHLAGIDLADFPSSLSLDEVNAIRKTMARLHHPDTGGSTERMKAWNAALDRFARIKVKH